MFLVVLVNYKQFRHIKMGLDNNFNDKTEGDQHVAFSLLEAFAGPAQGKRVGVPPSAAVP
jgi:hypothetical protein